LRSALESLEPPVEEEAALRLATLLRLLGEWKGAGLVGFRGDEQLAVGYFRESLELRGFLPPEGPYLDIGSGGGAPALPLAAAGSGVWTLLEPRRTASAFLEFASRKLLPPGRVEVERCRLAEWLRRREPDSLPFTAVTLRAVRLTRGEWTGLAAALRPGAVVIWPTSPAGRSRAEIPDRLFREQEEAATRGIVWRGFVG